MIKDSWEQKRVVSQPKKSRDAVCLYWASLGRRMQAAFIHMRH